LRPDRSNVAGEINVSRYARRDALRRFVAVAAVLFLVSTSGLGQAAPRRSGAMRHATLKGSGAATMQVVTMPVRIGRVAVVPGAGETWAVGHSSSSAFRNAGPAGQLVFLRRLPGGEWIVTGPPRTAAGAATNPTLFALSFARSGEGWAVGSNGAMIRRLAGSDAWVAATAVTPNQLSSVSLAPSGGGYAVGKAATILRLNGTTWATESPGTDLTADGLPNLTAVSAVSADEAWAISGSSSENLLIYHRTGGVWRRVRTNQRIFDGPSRPADAPNGGTVDSSFGSAVAATSSGAWVGGMIFPSDATHPFGDETPGAVSRPFVVHVSKDGGTVTSYCPDQYGVRARTGSPAGQVEVDRTMMCDEPFPLSAFDVTSIATLGSEVFAGGLGLYHFRSGGWFREPDAQGYIISLAMSSPREGWLATTGNTYGAGGAIHSSEATLGHWTTEPETPRVARWPQAQVQPLEAVAVAPRGAGRAVGVGVEGAVVTYEPSAGWDGVHRVVVEALHAVAYSDPEEAWAVGENGALQRYDGVKWERNPLSGAISLGASLFGVAFDATGEGYAVGARGTILRYDGVAWSRDRASRSVTGETLYSIAATPTGFVAVGGKGTVIERDARGWHAVGSVAGLITRPGSPTPPLYSVATQSDGTVWAGGAGGALVVRHAGGTFSVAQAPLEGTILALAAAKAGPRLYASVSPDVAKYRGDRITTTRSVVMANEGGAWRDISFSRRRSIYTGVDSSAYVDPALGLATGTDGAGWAVGGSPASQPDVEGHLRTLPTSSIDRFDLDNDPVPPDVVADIDLPTDGLTFAVFGESWCGRGVCSATLGSGTQADLVALQIQREIEQTGRMSNGPRFVMFVGNGRSIGVPDELEQFKGYLDDFSLPIYGALGDRELFAGLDDSPAGEALSRTNARTSASNDYWKEVFVDRRLPWGESKAPKDFDVVQPTGTAGPTAGLARTHYAFDYAPKGKKAIRVVVIDSSTKSYGRQPDQNPEESQGDWLEKVLLDAKGLGGNQAIPTIIVMNQPTVVPDRTQVPNWLVDATTFEESVTRNAVTAVFTGGMRTNTSGAYTGAARVPLYILGGGGAPLGFEHATVIPSKEPSDGFYNAWHLVHVGESKPTATGLPQASITVTPFPVLESLAMHAVDGRSVPGGQTLRFSALARSLPGGSSDPDQSKATYFWLGSDAPLLCEEKGQGGGSCSSRDALKPPYQFSSENPDIADFVRPSPSGGPQDPMITKGEVVRDPGGQGGLLCTFKAGTAHINVVSGYHRSRMAIKVGGGYGPCVKAPVVDVPRVDVPAPLAEAPVPQAGSRPVSAFFPRNLEALSVILPPPPAPVVAPAPPGAPGVGRKEEHEVSTETEGHQQGGVGKHSFTAHREQGGPASTWPYLGTIVLIAFMGACVGSAARRKLIEPRRAVVSDRRSQ
jgi:hypothetical protein